MIIRLLLKNSIIIPLLACLKSSLTEALAYPCCVEISSKRQATKVLEGYFLLAALNDASYNKELKEPILYKIKKNSSIKKPSKSQTNFRKVDLLSQYWQNGNTEVRGKWLTLNYDVLTTSRRRKVKFGENAF